VEGVTVDRVDIHINNGRVEVSGGPVDDVEVEDETGLTVKQQGNKVSINGNSADVVAYVPESARVDVHANRAEVSVLGVAALNVHFNHGEIDAGDIDGKVEIHGNEAEVSIDNVDGPIDIHLNRGELFIRVAPGETVRADIHVDRGDIVNQVPRGDDVNVKVHMNKGDVTIVSSAPDS
jgi:hypothetical protein